MTLPYHSMTADELIREAENGDDALCQALAAKLEEVNGKVEDLEKELEDKESEIEDLEGSIEDLKSFLKELRDAAQDATENLTTAIYDSRL